jgi:hypothetical protein
MGYALLDGEEAKATKILGKDAKFPDRKVDIGKLGETQKTAYDAFSKTRDDLSNRLADFENANQAIMTGLKQLAAAYEKNDFGLNPKNKDDLKRITMAQKLFSNFFAGEIKAMETMDKGIDELEKHLVQLSRYKGPK